jgi:hypothetical protein
MSDRQCRLCRQQAERPDPGDFYVQRDVHRIACDRCGEYLVAHGAEGGATHDLRERPSGPVWGHAGMLRRRVPLLADWSVREMEHARDRGEPTETRLRGLTAN